jgi:hypothetical protein
MCQPSSASSCPHCKVDAANSDDLQRAVAGAHAPFKSSMWLRAAAIYRSQDLARLGRSYPCSWGARDTANGLRLMRYACLTWLSPRMAVRLNLQSPLLFLSLPIDIPITFLPVSSHYFSLLCPFLPVLSPRPRTNDTGDALALYFLGASYLRNRTFDDTCQGIYPLALPSNGQQTIARAPRVRLELPWVPPLFLFLFRFRCLSSSLRAIDTGQRAVTRRVLWTWAFGARVLHFLSIYLSDLSNSRAYVKPRYHRYIVQR